MTLAGSPRNVSSSLQASSNVQAAARAPGKPAQEQGAPAWTEGRVRGTASSPPVHHQLIWEVRAKGMQDTGSTTGKVHLTSFEEDFYFSEHLQPFFFFFKSVTTTQSSLRTFCLMISTNYF